MLKRFNRLPKKYGNSKQGENSAKNEINEMKRFKYMYIFNHFRLFSELILFVNARNRLINRLRNVGQNGTESVYRLFLQN